jgi:hypothetical protein
MAWAARLITRRIWLAANLSAPLGWSLAAPGLLIRREEDHLRISAPQIRFLNGKPLEQLKNGANVGFISQISLTTESNVIIKQYADRFVVSYDLWEEKFSATRLGPPRQSVSRLSIPAAEAWCLDEIAPIPPALTPSTFFRIKLELRVEDPKESAGIVGDPGINLTRLVEIFSAPPRNPQQRWMETAGPLRLQDL